MLTTDIRIEVPGEPRPQGQLIGRGRAARIHIYTPAVKYVVGKGPDGKPVYCSDRLKPWKHAIAKAAREIIPSGIIADFGPVELDFFVPRTQEFEKAKHADTRLPCRSRYFGDADNLAKPVLDALTKADAILTGNDELGGIWRDDAEVYELQIRKWFVHRGCAPGVRIVIRASPAPTAPALFAGATA